MMDKPRKTRIPISEETARELLHFLETSLASRSLGGSSFGSPQTEKYKSIDCPSRETYMKLALGSLRDNEVDRLLTHAIACDPCCQALRIYLEAMDGRPSAEESAAIAEMAAMQHSWQAELARKLATTSRRPKPAFLRTPAGRMAGIGSIAALVLFSFLALTWLRSQYEPDRQLAIAYSEHRSLELRIPRADWARYIPQDHTRGDATDEEVPALLDARANLARSLEKAPQDHRLLELQARADLLDQRYDAAVDVLDSLVASGPVTAQLLTDAASAYFERGLATGSELDRSTALDYLRRADELAPTDPVVLFNEGIVMEDRGQVMNAVEVWNRYLTAERDPKWAAEGRRRLDALEQTLNRLKSHRSRIDKMLATPASMDALAADGPRLASLDEELSSYELDKLLLAAYPVADGSATTLPGGRTARASPCEGLCPAARRLLKALGRSLEIHHQDPWLADFIAPDPDKLPTQLRTAYSKAMRAFAVALREDLEIKSTAAEHTSAESSSLFHSLAAQESRNIVFHEAARVGELRASLEQMQAIQERTDFDRCRDFAERRASLWREDSRYPWIRIVQMATDVVCNGAPKMRMANKQLTSSALELAESSHYWLLTLRIGLRTADAASDSGDMETTERIVSNQLKLLESRDSPVFRLINPLAVLTYADEDVVGVRTAELYDLELLHWLEWDGPKRYIPTLRLELARLYTRLGQMQEAEEQFRLAYGETEKSSGQYANPRVLVDAEMNLASLLLQRNDLRNAQIYLQRARSHMTNFSEPWGLRKFASTSGQLKLELGDYGEAAKDLEAQILRSEGRNSGTESRVARSEFAEGDHDLYAELAAAWLAEGRPGEEVLALWERFRMRSRDLPISSCDTQALTCDLPKLKTAIRHIGNNVILGQILLLDRVLIYRVDRNGVVWRQIQFQRQDVLTAEEKFEKAVSSPTNWTKTMGVLGEELRDNLLPDPLWPSSTNAVLLIEPDPLLNNLPWPAIPTPAGPLGLVLPVAEVRSMLAMKTGAAPTPGRSSSSFANEGRAALIIGASITAADEVPLPEVIQEAESVDRFLAAPELLVGAKATSANVAAHINSATIFHFAGHAVRRTNGTELLLAPSSRSDQQSWLDGAFFREHPPRSCRLAVLSACATGTQEAGWMHPFQNIVESLASAGVDDVVATRWQIDSEAAVPFMSAFYSSLAQGNSAPVALWTARRVLSQHSLYKSPYYWAAYFVTSGQVPEMNGETYAQNQKGTGPAETLRR